MKIKIETLLVAFAIMLNSNLALAQQEPSFTQYTDNILYYNPAYAGSRGMLNIAALHHQQWIGVSGAPVTQSLQVHSPLQYESVGLGFSLINDKAGPLNQTWANADFSYSLKFKDGGKLAFGIKAGLNMINGDLAKLYTLQSNDPTLQYSFRSKIMPNVGAGMYYHSKQWFVGAAVPKLIESKMSPGSLNVVTQRHYYAMAGGFIKASRMLKIRPSAMLKLTSNAPLSIDGSVAFIFYDKLWLAANYRLKEGAGVYAQLQISNQLKIGYGVDITATRLQKYNFGSHEIMLSYDFIFKKRSLVSPRYF